MMKRSLTTTAPILNTANFLQIKKKVFKLLPVMVNTKLDISMHLSLKTHHITH